MPSIAKREPLDSEIGERLHWWMWRNRVTQVDLARQTGMSQPSLGRKLRGTTPWLASEIRDVAQAIGKPILWMYGEVDDEDSARPKGLEPLTFWSGVCEHADWRWCCPVCGETLVIVGQEQICPQCRRAWDIGADDLALTA